MHLSRNVSVCRVYVDLQTATTVIGLFVTFTALAASLLSEHDGRSFVVSAVKRSYVQLLSHEGNNKETVTGMKRRGHGTVFFLLLVITVEEVVELRLNVSISVTEFGMRQLEKRRRYSH